MVMQDEKLDKPMSKVKKIIKRIANNDWQLILKQV
jgi:hypothetical protein